VRTIEAKGTNAAARAERGDGPEQQELLEALRSVGRGDFSFRLATDGTGIGVEIAGAFNEVVELNARTARELRRISRVVGRQGRIAERASIREAGGEWARNVESINALIDQLTKPAIQVSAVLGAVAKGDLSRHMALDADGRPLQGEFLRWADIVNTMVDQLNAFAGEVTRVAHEVGTEGKLGGQADVPDVAGIWKDLTDSVNSMAGNLTGQVRNIAEVTTAVAQGDLSKKITVDVQGEILELKNTINTMVDQLNAFASEVTRVAREVGTEGKLGGQADVRDVGGTWKDLTESVNQLAANLTTQVRAIGDVATAVTRGDLSRAIEVQASGEVEVLKDDLNEMIRRLRDTTRENADQVWLKANLARFSGMLQGQRDLESVGRVILSELAPLIGVLSGALYLKETEETDGEEPVLRLLAAYAREGKGRLPTRVQIGEGLLGEAARERRRIVVSEVPASYLTIKSALGEAPPHMVAFLPILFEGETQAVIELATFDRFTETQLAFLDQLGETIGLVLNAIAANAKAAAFVQEQAARAEAEAGLARLRQVVDVMPEGIMLADAAGSVYLHNAAAAEILGEVPTSVIPTTEGLPIYRRLDGSVSPPEDQPLARAVFRQEVVRGEQLIVTNAITGREVPILVNSAPLSDTTSLPAGGVTVFQDITPLHDLDRQRDEFLAAVSHDLRTPVAIIKGRTNLLQRAVRHSDRPDATEVASGLQTIDDSTVHLVRLIDELLDLMRLRMGHPVELDLAPTDLIEIARRLADEYQKMSPDHPIRVEADGDSLVGTWDKARLERVVSNLLSNAVKYGVHGGEIHISLAREEDDGQEWAVLAVRNHGLGIPAGELDRVFDVYYRGTNVSETISGTGVGLAGARHIVEQHGGSIGAESVPGETTTFTVRLPLNQELASSRST
jgi:PAS domain S-box-containing protein